jgi:hypothetical protein
MMYELPAVFITYKGKTTIIITGIEKMPLEKEQDINLKIASWDLLGCSEENDGT